MPLTKAAIECSLTPKGMSLAAGSPREKSRPGSITVLVEPARSADPPMNPGAFRAISSNSFPEEARVAILSPMSSPSPSRATGSGACSDSHRFR